MFISLYTARLLYVAHTGKAMPGDMPFAQAAELVRAERHPRAFARMVAMGEALKNRRDIEVDAAAEYVRLAGHAGHKLAPNALPPVTA